MVRLIHKLEKFIALIIWSGNVFYSLYCFYLFSSKIYPFINHTDFKKGWFYKRPKDISDLEWNIISFSFIKYFPLIVTYFSLSQCFQIMSSKFFVHFILVYDIFFIINVLSFKAFICILINIIIVILIHLRLQKVFAYLFLFFILTCVSYPEFTNFKDYLFEKNVYKKFLFEVSIVWLNAKLISFNFDRLKSFRNSCNFDFIFAKNVKKITIQEYLNIFAYLLYIPTFFTGPINHYEPFVENLNRRKLWNLNRMLFLFFKLFKYIFWIFIFEISLHYFYTSLQFYPFLLNNIDNWSLCGFCYCMGCLFFLKYFIIYGLAQLLSEFDQIEVPPPPQCVTQIHSPSLLWRYFDRGLYLWLKEYFYKPMISGNYNLSNKISASFICFTYVCLWHKMEDSSIVWCLFNFVLISIEKLILHFINQKDIKLLIDTYSTNTKLRLNSLFFAPFYVLLIASNIYFLSNVEVGNYIMRNIVLKFPNPSIYLLLIMYFACYFSISRRNMI